MKIDGIKSTELCSLGLGRAGLNMISVDDFLLKNITVKAGRNCGKIQA